MSDDRVMGSDSQESDSRSMRSVSRREFLKIAGTAGAVVAVGAGLGGILEACGSAATTTTQATTATTQAATATTTAATATTAAGTATTAAGTATTVSAGAQGLAANSVTVALADGFGGNAWRKVVRLELEDEATKFPEIKQPILYSDANGSAQKAIADIQAFKNQGVDILLILPDQGPALYNTIAAATAAGVITVPALIGMDPKGDPKYGTLTNDPKAYSCYVDTDSVVWGQAYGAYIAQNITTGNGFFLGGPAGNSYSSGVFKGMTEYLAKNAPGVKMQGPTWTGWDLQKGAAAAQTLVSQMDSVDVITADYGAMLEPVIDAIKALGKPLPKVVAIQDYNGARKVWSQNNKSFKLGITGARTFGIRIALDAGLALKRGENVCSLSQWSIQSTPVQRYASRELSMTCVPSFPQYQMDMYDCATDPTRGGYAADQPDEYYFDIGLSADALKQVFSK